MSAISRHREVTRLVHEYLTASMLMVPLDDRLDGKTLTGDAKSYLDQHGYDLALLDTREVRTSTASGLQISLATH